MRMRTNPSQKLFMNDSVSTWASIQHRDYIGQMNFNLINELNEVQTEKHFYKNKLSYESKAHHSELQEAFRVISQKNTILIDLEERIARQDRQYRMLKDDFSCLKNNYEAEKQYAAKEIANIRAQCQEKIKKMEQQFESRYEAKLAKRVHEVQQQCQARVKHFKQQAEQLVENSRKLLHELTYLQEEHRQMLLKNDTIIQESIQRELRKRDFQAQNNYLRDLAQFQSVKKERNQLKERLTQVQDLLDIQKKQSNSLKAQLEAQTTRSQNLEAALANQKQKNIQKIEQKISKETQEFQTNTEQPYVPIIMPVDMNLMAEVVGVRDFVVQKIIERFLDFYCKTASTDPKKRSFSLTTFKNSLGQLAEANPQNKILLFIQTSLQRVIKVYCPAMSYSRDYLTVKDQFIKRVLLQCETISNPTQKLYRLLELVHRLKHPINHIKSQVTGGELKLLQIKIMACLKKILS